MRVEHSWQSALLTLVLLGVAPACPAASGRRRQPRAAPQQASLTRSASALPWQSPARGRRGLRHLAGTLTIDTQGVEFHLDVGPPERWGFIEIKTFTLKSHKLSLTTYQNRGWHRGGDRGFRFMLAHAVPPTVARELASRVNKPSINGVPEPGAQEFAEIAARHATRTGGSNGRLRLRDGGIDYITAAEADSRSWRWDDIETIASPDPYHFRVAAYRETFEFELKQRLAEDVFNRLWDHVYARGLQVTPTQGGNAQ